MVVCAPRIHVLSQQLDLRLHLPPQLIVIQFSTLLITAASDSILGPVAGHRQQRRNERLITAACDSILGPVPGNRQQRRNERLIEVREAEVLSNTCDSRTQFLWELDRWCFFELLATPWTSRSQYDFFETETSKYRTRLGSIMNDPSMVLDGG